MQEAAFKCALWNPCRVKAWNEINSDDFGEKVTSRGQGKIKQSCISALENIQSKRSCNLGENHGRSASSPCIVCNSLFGLNKKSISVSLLLHLWSWLLYLSCQCCSEVISSVYLGSWKPVEVMWNQALLILEKLYLEYVGNRWKTILITLPCWTCDLDTEKADRCLQSQISRN